MRHKEVWIGERQGSIRHENGTLVIPVYVKDHDRHVELRVCKSKVEPMILAQINTLSRM